MDVTNHDYGLCQKCGRRIAVELSDSGNYFIKCFHCGENATGYCLIKAAAILELETGIAADPNPLPSPGDTYAGRKVLAVVEGLVSNPEHQKSGSAVMIWPKGEAPGPNVAPITAVILEGEG